MRKGILTVAVGCAVVGLAGAADVVQATPDAGVERVEHARGSVAVPATADVSEGADIVVATLTIEPGGTSGWHTHPGPELLVVKSGTLTFYQGDDRTCEPVRYSAGQAFVWSGALHQGRNEGPEPVEVVVTSLNVPQGSPVREDGAAPAQCPTS